MDKLLKAVRGRRSGGNQFERDPLEQRQELLICFTAKGPEHRRLIQSHGAKRCRIQIAVTDALIIGHQNAALCRSGLSSCSHILGRIHAEQFLSVPGKLLPHTKRQHNQRPLAGVLRCKAAVFKFLHRLAKAERLKQSPPATMQRPDHSVTLMRLQCRIQSARVGVKS